MIFQKKRMVDFGQFCPWIALEDAPDVGLRCLIAHMKDIIIAQLLGTKYMKFGWSFDYLNHCLLWKKRDIMSQNIVSIVETPIKFHIFCTEKLRNLITFNLSSQSLEYKRTKGALFHELAKITCELFYEM